MVCFIYTQAEFTGRTYIVLNELVIKTFIEFFAPVRGVGSVGGPSIMAYKYLGGSLDLVDLCIAPPHDGRGESRLSLDRAADFPEQLRGLPTRRRAVHACAAP